jgi:hypothetical protein
MKKRKIAALFFLIISLAVYSQDKYEKEYRVEKSEVPASAIEFIDKTYPEASNLKWYLEESTLGKSYEAKLKWNKKKHSVEFTFEGKIMDIEIEIKERNMPEESMSLINKKLASEFEKFRISKIQIQYTGTPEQLTKAVLNDYYGALEKKFEVVLSGKTETSIMDWEVLFDSSGDIVSKKRILEKPDSNLDF